MLRENTIAVKALTSLVRMPQDQHGSRTAIEHWRGPCGSPPEKNPLQENRTETSSHMAKLEGLPVIRAQVAGLDLASEVHWACAPGLDGTGLEVETFRATTPELERMAEWLKARKVESVAMECTGSRRSRLRGDLSLRGEREYLGSLA